MWENWFNYNTMKKTKQLFLIIVFAIMGLSPYFAYATGLSQLTDNGAECTAYQAGSITCAETFIPDHDITVTSMSVKMKNDTNSTMDLTVEIDHLGSTNLNSGSVDHYQIYGNLTGLSVSSTPQVYTIPAQGAYGGDYTLHAGQHYLMWAYDSQNPRGKIIYNSSTNLQSQNMARVGHNGVGYTGFSGGDLYFSVNEAIPPSCFDGIQNQDETGIDTGGVCTPAVLIPVVCTDGIMNGDETGIDTGGRCKTHIIGFTPENGTTVPGPNVTFTMDVWTNPEDIGTFIGVNLNLHNIDQNVLLLNGLSPSDIYLLDEFRVPSAGLYHYESTKVIGNGNYTLEATLSRAYLGGWIINPFSDINQTIAKHFIVGEGTFIGTVSQSGYDALNGTASGAVVPGTTIATVAGNCNPFAGVFDVQKCGIYLFVPGGEYFNKTMKDMKDGLLTRMPWGYFYRVYDIWNNPSKTSLPAMDFPVYMGPGNTDNPGIEHITIDPGDMIAGAGNLLDDIRDPHTNKNMKDVFGPMVQLTFALAVVFTIVADLTGSHKHDTGGEKGGKKYV